jgi:hypothetical protein
MSVARTIADMLAKSTDRWAKQRKAEIRDANARFRRADRMSRRARPLNQTEAAARVMRAAYMTASANGTLPANPRQIYYAARPEMLRLTEKTSIDSKYFTQTLLTEYMRLRPDATADWNIAWDDRGHFSEPHTRVEIGLGTLAVRSYIKGHRDLLIRNGAISVADIKTKGPDGRYGAVLFLEKEGFTQILEAARIADRYDLAIMSTKGMSVTAARTLVEDLCGKRGLKLLVLHDFDVSGFSIKQTLVTSNRRHEFKHAINTSDLGLRLADVEEMGLDAEPTSNKGNDAAIARRLRINGATEKEVAFLIGGERVELNAMPSNVFVAFVERKLNECGVAKVIPSPSTLAEAYTAFRRGEAARAALKAEMARLNAEPVGVPPDLDARVRAYLEENPERTWDAALRAIAGLDDDDSDPDADEDGDDNDDE